jgi:hypothetical protein
MIFSARAKRKGEAAAKQVAEHRSNIATSPNKRHCFLTEGVQSSIAHGAKEIKDISQASRIAPKKNREVPSGLLTK